MPNACVFCGSTTSKITKEHVPADWIGKLYDTDPLVQVELVQRDGTFKNFLIEPFEQTVRVVCEACNNGWMCELEGKVSPKLGPMIRDGRITHLTPYAQRLLATWAVKTAFMFCQLSPSKNFVPDSEYARFYAVKQPPTGYVVWIAHRMTFYDGTGREALIASREQKMQSVTPDSEESAEKLRADVADGRTGFILSFAIGRVVFSVFGHNFRGTFTVNEPLVKATQWIWPVQGKTTWPPSIAVETIGGFDALHKALSGSG